MDNTDLGYLIVSVSTAGDSLPLEGAFVTVANTGDGGIIRNLTTDSSGRTEKLSLPAPPKQMSLSPDNGEVKQKPFSEYTIRTEKEGYVSIENVNVPIFSGITSIQSVKMIPDPDGTQMENEEFFDEGRAPDL